MFQASLQSALTALVTQSLTEGTTGQFGDLTPMTSSNGAGGNMVAANQGALAAALLAAAASTPSLGQSLLPMGGVMPQQMTNGGTFAGDAAQRVPPGAGPVVIPGNDSSNNISMASQFSSGNSKPSLTSNNDNSNDSNSSSANNSGANQSSKSSAENGGTGSQKNDNQSASAVTATTALQNPQMVANNPYLSSLYQTADCNAAPNSSTARSNGAHPQICQQPNAAAAATQAALTDYMMAFAAQQRLLNSLNPALFAAALGGNNCAGAAGTNIAGLAFSNNNVSQCSSLNNCNESAGNSELMTAPANNSIEEKSRKQVQCQNGASMTASNVDCGQITGAEQITAADLVALQQSAVVAAMNDNKIVLTAALTSNSGGAAELRNAANNMSSSEYTAGVGASMEVVQQARRISSCSDADDFTEVPAGAAERDNNSNKITAGTANGDVQQQLLRSASEAGTISSNNCFGMTLPMDLMNAGANISAVASSAAAALVVNASNSNSNNLSSVMGGHANSHHMNNSTIGGRQHQQQVGNAYFAVPIKSRFYI